MRESRALDLALAIPIFPISVGLAPSGTCQRHYRAASQEIDGRGYSRRGYRICGELAGRLGLGRE
jgi:hypothetical protein